MIKSFSRSCWSIAINIIKCVNFHRQNYDQWNKCWYYTFLLRGIILIKIQVVVVVIVVVVVVIIVVVIVVVCIDNVDHSLKGNQDEGDKSKCWKLRSWRAEVRRSCHDRECLFIQGWNDKRVNIMIVWNEDSPSSVDANVDWNRRGMEDIVWGKGWGKEKFVFEILQQ